jgi:DNA-3-methyladenine glycosylase
MILPKSFYTRDDVVLISRELLGKVLFSSVKGKITAGIITETEAYDGIADRASHAFGGRRTTRTEVMYAMGGIAYIYLCYGIHSLFNIVTSVEGKPHAILVRSIRPLLGIETMNERSVKQLIDSRDVTGPGKVTKILGIHFNQSGWSLVYDEAHPLGDRLWIEDMGINIDPSEIITGPRVGVEYAGDDALLPYRFRITL